MTYRFYSKRKDLPKNFNGSRTRPIRQNEDFGVWSIEKLKDVNIYVEKDKTFDFKFWKTVYNNNLAIIFVELKK